MKKITAILCALTLLLGATAIVPLLPAAAEDVARRPAANGQVAWLADFGADNNDAWQSGAHSGTPPQMPGKLHGAQLVSVADVSEDGAGATIKDKASDVPGLVGTKISADFSRYNKLVLKATYTGSNSAAFRSSVHNGEYVNSNWQATKPSISDSLTGNGSLTIGENGAVFMLYDVSKFTGADYMWFTIGWFLCNTDSLKIDYLALTTDTVTDEATATAAVAKYLAGEQYVDPNAPREVAAKAFDAATDTKQTFINGALRLELSVSDLDKLMAAKPTVTLTDGKNPLIWNLADYTLVPGKINTLMLPFTEAKNANIFSDAAKKTDLAAVTGVSLTAAGLDADVSVAIGKVDFVNFAELLDRVGIVFFDSANISSTLFHGVVEGEHGGAYRLGSDVDPCEYVHKDMPEWCRRFGAPGETFSFNAASRKRLNVEFRIKLEGVYDRICMQMTSFVADGSYADQTWGITFFTRDSAKDLSNGWVTVSSADEDDADAWHVGGSNICDLSRLLNMRILGFRNGNNESGNQGSVLIDYMMITDSDRYEGLDNLYLYGTADMDGQNFVSPFEKEDPPESDGSDESDESSGSTPAESSEPSGDASADSSDDTTAESGDASDDNPDTGAALPLAALLLTAVSAGAVTVSRRRK
mgnify:FL=1